MPFAPFVTTLEGLPEPVAKEYVKKDDGKFYLQVTPTDGWALENIVGLKNSVQSARNERDAFAEKLKPFEGIDPTKAKDALSKIDEIATWSPDKKTQEIIAAKERQITEKFTPRIGELETTVKTLNADLDREVLGNQIATACAKYEAEQVLLEPVLRGRIKRVVKDGQSKTVVYEEDGKTEAMTRKGTDTSAMTVDELVETYKTKSPYSRAFKGTGASGTGGEQGGQGGGGTSYGNLTGQELLSAARANGAKTK